MTLRRFLAVLGEAEARQLEQALQTVIALIARVHVLVPVNGKD
jgi:hypothetical protein